MERSTAGRPDFSDLSLVSCRSENENEGEYEFCPRGVWYLVFLLIFVLTKSFIFDDYFSSCNQSDCFLALSSLLKLPNNS